MDKNKLAAIIQGKARAMCTPEYDRKINEATNIRKGRPTNNTQYYDPDPASFDDYQEYDNMYLSESTQEINGNDMMYTNEAVKNSNLPDAFKQSLMEERIHMKSNVSVTDDLFGTMPQQPKQRVRKKVNEQVSPINNVVQPTAIDYSIIKAIVNECLKEHLGQQTLNESTTLKTIALKEGTISLVDNKGNIFKAKLEKIK
jgi:hypothetical protein